MNLSQTSRNSIDLPLFGFGTYQLSEDDMNRLNDLNQNQPIAWAANGLNPMAAAPPLEGK